MTTTIRAKFRCMSIARTWEGAEICEFLPVKRDGRDPENEIFWKYTPSGEVKLVYKGECGFDPGAFYYIDMTPAENGEWTVDTVTRRANGSGDVNLSSAWKPATEEGFRHGTVELGIDSDRVVDLFGLPGAKWNVVFSFAEASDG